ncbi:DMP19 family protein [Paenibacillus glycanilyticus]|uniref:DNA mimic protein DMP19 C-terminal domain-containing protein n=1 Tax=Paenibacillus glycanilyticus TaxID=126569 RepID=A0ABQ6GJY7_9BACL|nr:DUF4375 domain-containing protein [Paenibacillus glycanilyticus]GLX69352.1 hypothetical protein MU1_36970 [Paenibacillus glycanilyticus]
MEDIKELVRSLLSELDLNTLTSVAIIEHIASNMYERDYTKLREKEVFIQLPIVLQDILLILDFDIELQMNGIIGFIENSTGNYFEETIQTLFRIGATDDFEIINNIKRLLISNGITPIRLRENVNESSLYQVTYSSDIHGDDLAEVLNEISSQADYLYLYRDNDNIFDNLFHYLDVNKVGLIRYLGQ